MADQKSDKKKPHLSTHVLDTCRGIPASELPVQLFVFANETWILLKESLTNSNGRCEDFLENEASSLSPGRYKLHFKVDRYFDTLKITSMYPCIDVIFQVNDSQDHYHVPLLLGPFGYTTYRGS
ncbi:5-hydroxyisourate hydrolase [Prorops nasuta]|uniref:5-hydroxyisourate hydrolase n=1 Tax=Prorops nasuta TaxID=863751 RepID=UPI0034CF63A4